MALNSLFKRNTLKKKTLSKKIHAQYSSYRSSAIMYELMPDTVFNKKRKVQFLKNGHNFRTNHSTMNFFPVIWSPEYM